ncbi:hypothetical protein HYH03_016881 [Edaphochlamys debaryana]|uniref:MYND-type domain-containing protein n=1 Tax=Edaphochlamys debaryana TaxID=47281 RepID=A0A835XQL7_9CHLO|nr:hypothetical protein HYH03_016881 [Edaphochlamys debaryana]|eukprot:KAG2484339.1 hypothetical protein HYH03_016881 [Edaphochlamys debaryana]
MEGPVPGPGCMFVSVDHLNAQPAAAAGAGAGEAGVQATKWHHPGFVPRLTVFGDVSKQQPRVVRCACGGKAAGKACELRSVSERSAVPDHLIPEDWASKFELPPDTPEFAATQNRRASALELFLNCTNRAEKELPPAEGQEHASEPAVLAAAEGMFTDALKGRVCFACEEPSLRMQKCGRCHQARYCSRDCQRSHWSAHKAQCGQPAAQQAGTAEGKAEAAAEGKAEAAAEGKAEAAAEGKAEDKAEGAAAEGAKPEGAAAAEAKAAAS